MAHTDCLEYAYKLIHNLQIKTVKDELDDGYDSEKTGDLTSDDTDEDEIY